MPRHVQLDAYDRNLVGPELACQLCLAFGLTKLVAQEQSLLLRLTQPVAQEQPFLLCPLALGGLPSAHAPAFGHVHVSACLRMSPRTVRRIGRTIDIALKNSPRISAGMQGSAADGRRIKRANPSIVGLAERRVESRLRGDGCGASRAREGPASSRRGAAQTGDDGEDQKY